MVRRAEKLHGACTYRFVFLLFVKRKLVFFSQFVKRSVLHQFVDNTIYFFSNIRIFSETAAVFFARKIHVGW